MTRLLRTVIGRSVSIGAFVLYLLCDVWKISRVVVLAFEENGTGTRRSADENCSFERPATNNSPPSTARSVIAIPRALSPQLVFASVAGMS